MARGVANQRRTRSKISYEVESNLLHFRRYLDRGNLIECADSLKLAAIALAHVTRLIQKDIKERNKHLADVRPYIGSSRFSTTTGRIATISDGLHDFAIKAGMDLKMGDQVCLNARGEAIPINLPKTKGLKNVKSKQQARR